MNIVITSYDITNTPNDAELGALVRAKLIKLQQDKVRDVELFTRMHPDWKPRD